MEDQTLKVQFVTMIRGDDGDWEERPLDLGHRDAPSLIPSEIKKA